MISFIPLSSTDGGAWAAPLRNETSVGRHIGQTFQLLVQHLRDHADLFVLELAQQCRRSIVGHERLTGRIGVHEHAQGDVEPDAVILFEQLLEPRKRRHSERALTTLRSTASIYATSRLLTNWQSDREQWRIRGQNTPEWTF